jgi:hypothetical protein
VDIDPLDLKDKADEAAEAKSRLNAMVAVTIALLATFMGICKVKDDNIVQAMQQAQADKVDWWATYQAKSTQAKVYEVGALTAKLTAQTASGAARASVLQSQQKLEARSAHELADQAEDKANAEKAGKDYDDLNYRDDQFDLSDTLLALAISLLAITALTQKRWLYWLSLVPTFFGVLMGTAGLFELKIHPDALSRLLSWLSGFLG